MDVFAIGSALVFSAVILTIWLVYDIVRGNRDKF
jgi:hypothetical protein